MFKWLKNRIKHKLDHFSYEKIKGFLKKNGLPFVVIFIGWEIVEDVIFPFLFAALGSYIHPAFYAGIPASIILCSHWLAVPILWGAWLKISNNNTDNDTDKDIDCCSSHEH